MGKKYLTYDYGASSGRGILADFDGEKISVKEIHRFTNDPVFAFGHYYWDLLRLFGEMKAGMVKLAREGVRSVEAMGVDTWGVDFALLDEYDKPLSNPLYYRDGITDGEMERVFSVVPKRELYSATGIQFMKFNTIFQLSAIRRIYPKLLDRTRTMLLMPDMLNFMLTGVKSAEYSIASTTQLLDVNKADWDIGLINKLGLPSGMFLPVSQPGHIIGSITEQTADETGLNAKVASVCGHDTGSAVIAVPMAKGEHCAYISCGTWSLLGVELASPRSDDAAFRIDYTNEGGFGKTIRFLKNIMGLWIYQEVKREAERKYGEVDYKTLDQEIAAAPQLGVFIDPDAPEFFEKGHMTEKIQSFCRKTGQRIPESRGEILRCALESLAFKYRYAVEKLEALLGYRLDVIRVVGGGCKDRLLMSFTGKATGRKVLAGPVEATAIGNICAQLIATGEVADVWQAREIVASSFGVEDFTACERDGWDDAYERFLKIVEE